MMSPKYAVLSVAAPLTRAQGASSVVEEMFEDSKENTLSPLAYVPDHIFPSTARLLDTEFVASVSGRLQGRNGDAKPLPTGLDLISPPGVILCSFTIISTSTAFHVVLSSSSLLAFFLSERFCASRASRTSSGFFWRMRASLGLACAQATTLASQGF